MCSTGTGSTALSTSNHTMAVSITERQLRLDVSRAVQPREFTSLVSVCQEAVDDGGSVLVHGLLGTSALSTLMDVSLRRSVVPDLRLLLITCSRGSTVG